MIVPTYVLTPLATWLVAGLIKFIIHSIQAKKLAFNMINYGGMPSTHAAIVSSMATLVGLKEGFDTACFGVALTLMIIVFVDAVGLRKHIEKQSILLNKLSGARQLRERIGHSILEIGAGFLLGCLMGLWGNY
jgi:acid phosphatase family membrane protein YuiD